MRPEQVNLAILQGAITTIGATIAYVIATPQAAKSFGYGGAVAVVGTLYLAWRYFVAVRREKLAAEWILRQAYKTALERFMLAVFMLAAGFEILKLAPLWLLMGFVISQVAWLAAPVWIRLRTQNDK